LSSKDSDFWKKPGNWDAMSEAERFQWMMARFKAEEDQSNKIEMYCIRCKTFFKYVALHLSKEHPGLADHSFIITKEEFESRRIIQNPELFKQKEGILWSWGVDPARERDYHTIVINGISSRKKEPWLPRLRDLFRVKKVDYIINLNFMIKDLAPKYPPAIIHVDSTRDPTFAEIIQRKFGKNRVNAYHFANAGNTNTKFELKLIGKAYINQGYTFPDVDTLLRLNKISADKAFLVRELKTEALREIAKLTKNDRITFDQPKHNDLVHGWEMSLKGIMEIQKGRIGANYSALSSIHGATYAGPGDAISPKEKIERTLIARMKDRNFGTISSLKINLPQDDFSY
jgi:hypothetical protein